MTKPKDDATTDEQAPASDSSATVPNSDLEHRFGGAHTRDVMDAGVPVAPPSDEDRKAANEAGPYRYVGPEDALGAAPTRGDYSDRIEHGPHRTVEKIPVDEREDDGPTQRLVDQTPSTPTG